MDALTMSRRSEQIAELSPSDFSTKITSRTQLLGSVNAVVQEGISDGTIEPWEYPQIEHALGVFASALHGVPVTPVSGYSRN